MSEVAPTQAEKTLTVRWNGMCERVSSGSEALPLVSAGACVRVFVCRTCPRPKEARGPVADTGLQIAAALEERFAGNEAFVVRRVECLSGCRSPCNVRIACRDKASYSFHILDLSDIDDLGAFASRYWATADGSVGQANFPPGLKDRVASKIVSRAANRKIVRQDKIESSGPQ